MTLHGRRAQSAGGEAPVRTFHVSKSYFAGQYALQDVSFEVGNPAERVR